VANAFIYDLDLDLHNRIDTIKKIPLPIHDTLTNEKVGVLAQNLLDSYQDSNISDSNIINQQVLELDAAILKCYDLPPVLEKQLLFAFQGKKRPLMNTTFTGYYPIHYDAALPLHVLISQSFKDSNAINIKNSLKVIDNERISEILSWISGD
jgi:hypothetical protein